MFICGINSLPQTVYQPVQSDIYNYLERMFINGIINFHSEIKPVSRTEIAKQLFIIEKNVAQISAADKEELQFYKAEYFDEFNRLENDTLRVKRLEYFEKGAAGRFRFFTYNDNRFSFFADPVFGYSVSSVSDEILAHRWNGLQIFGYYDNNWGFDLNFRDNDESGKHIDFLKTNSPLTGNNISKQSKENLQYTELRGGISYTWNSGALTAGKDFFNIGSGNEGQLIISSKAPSFPFIRFDFYPVDWLRFIYFHGWLKSGIPDSSSIRKTLVEGRPAISPVSKFIALHMISFYPNENISISIGESIVYSESPEPLYFIPVMFFRLADHYLSSKESNSGANAQLFADFSYRFSSIRSKFYATLFVDELSLEALTGGNNLSAIGYTIGATISDPLFIGSSLNIEYSRLNPFVYMNSNDANLFTNNGYQLGHWIGSNSDIFSMNYSQKIIQPLSVKISGWYFRKGQSELPEQQYKLPYPHFLYGQKRIDKNVTFSVKYRFMHALFATAYYTYSDISDLEEGRTPAFKLGQFNNFGVSVFYNL